MASDVIAVRNLSVAFRSYPSPRDFLLEVLLGGTRHDTFWALRNVSFTVKEGERVGIVGPNGAGKSTLLQTITGSLHPTEGSATVTGKLSSLLSLVPAWNPDQSGLENIKFNLQMRGLDADKIPVVTEEIVEFTDIGPYVYNPLKTYSSGMSARLAFAIATAIEPDILVIDEVLGTGDGYFAGRANRRLQQMCAKGRALLLVSHATAAIRSMCNRCIWIENGAIRQDGSVEQVLRHYEEDMLRHDEETNRAATRARRAALVNVGSREDFALEQAWLMRLRPTHGGRFADTHFVRDIALSLNGVARQVPLEAQDVRGSDAPVLLSQSCEWGRIYEKGGHPSRMLLSRAGMRTGGIIRIPKPVRHEGAVDVELRFLETSVLRTEQLGVEFLDLSDGVWRPLDAVRREADGWTECKAVGTLAAPGTELDTQALVSRAEAALRKPVEILDVRVEAGGQPVLSIREFEPFRIVVELEHVRRLPSVSVNVNILRSDGVYVFYQPSGISNAAIDDHDGRSRTIYEFDPNLFGAGDYEVNVFVTDTFTLEDGPPQDIIDRSIGRVQFRVDLARPISFGLINAMVDVRRELLPAQPLPPQVAPERLPRPLDFPPPFRRMVAFNSDVEWTSWKAQSDLMQIFGDHGLETAWSCWFFADPEATWRLFETDGTPSQHYEKAGDLIRQGLIDTNHSYGGVINGRGTPFGRAEIERAMRRFLDDGLSIPVYSNHGSYQDVQNVGGPWCAAPGEPVNSLNYQTGDLTGAGSYHLDLTLQSGARFFWLDPDYIDGPNLGLDATGANPLGLFTNQVARDGSPLIRFRRTHLGRPPLPDELGAQIDRILDAPAAGYRVVYNHLGFRRTREDRPGPNEAPYLTPQGFVALRRLADAQAVGDILVTTTERLLRHAFVHMVRPWTIQQDDDVLRVSIPETVTWNGVDCVMDWGDLAGLTLPADTVRRCEIVIGERRRDADAWECAGRRYVGLQWKSIAR